MREYRFRIPSPPRVDAFDASRGFTSASFGESFEEIVLPVHKWNVRVDLQMSLSYPKDHILEFAAHSLEAEMRGRNFRYKVIGHQFEHDHDNDEMVVQLSYVSADQDRADGDVTLVEYRKQARAHDDEKPLPPPLFTVEPPRRRFRIED